MTTKALSKTELEHVELPSRTASKARTAERLRLAQCTPTDLRWKKWGPYLSERQWGTVREDYSPHGNAWDYFPHDHARSRVYRWGEDGIAGFSDNEQRLCLSLALWNERDPILKERLFGLTNSEGNHGEDVKEIYYYLDATPTHSYVKMLYKYPQREFPYANLLEENRRRGIGAPEYELVDTDAFAENRYFDVFVEYAQADVDDVLMRITAHNRGPDAAVLHILPQLAFRNTWRWKHGAPRPEMSLVDGHVVATHEQLGAYHWYVDGELSVVRSRLCASGGVSDAHRITRNAQGAALRWLFTENETNTARLYGVANAGFAKDAFHEYVVHGNAAAINPANEGTKVAAWRRIEIPAGGSVEIRARLSNEASSSPFRNFDATLATRAREADEFYDDVQADIADDDRRAVQRQAFAGMIWSKQFFYFDIPEWLRGDEKQIPPPANRRRGRNSEWAHLNNADVISMPDKWEYPWYAAWDLAFHTLPLALIDAQFAKEQLMLLTREWYMHPNGQMPAYEWAFGDVNPPVHAWATWRVFQIDRKQRGDRGDLQFLERVFHKLMLNFTWWVNRKDAEGRNVFQGGFLGLDNIGVFDRSATLPTGGHIDQADGTSWMAMYALNLMRIALELAQYNEVYEDVATKFFEHFLHIAEAMNNLGEEGIGLWDDRDKFFYDVLHTADGRMTPLKVRSMVGLIPLFAVETLEPELLARVPNFAARLEWFLNYRPDLAKLVSHWDHEGRGRRRLLSLLRGHRMKKLLVRMLDPNEFLSDYGVRAISKVHERDPYVFRVNGSDLAVKYLPAESDSGLFGGNSNWRGPIWFPVNYLIIESLQKFHHYYGDDFKVECPVGSGQLRTINEVADELGLRLEKIFLKDERGLRPVLSQYPQLQKDPHFRDYILFHEYFHGDNGRGVGASHQTGWTGLVAKLLKPRAPEPDEHRSSERE
jgi:Glycosyl hydrolase family 63 C-terminal domain